MNAMYVVPSIICIKTGIMCIEWNEFILMQEKEKIWFVLNISKPKQKKRSEKKHDNILR